LDSHATPAPVRSRAGRTQPAAEGRQGAVPERTRRQRILHVVPSLKQGGIARVVLSLSGELVRQGAEVHILLLNDAVEFPVPPGVHIHHLPITGLARLPGPKGRVRRWGRRLFGKRLFWSLFSRRFVAPLERWVDGQPPFDGLFFHGLPVILPFSAWRTEDGTFCLHNMKSVQLRRREYPLLRRALRGRRIIAVSEALRLDASQHFGVREQDIQTIYNPFDLARIREQAQQPVELPPAAESEGYLVSVGRLSPQKRFDRLLRAYRASGVRQHLVIVGRGSEEPKIRAQIERMGLADRVHLVGFRANPYPYMSRAALFVLSSDYEGLSTAVIEALICGTPVLGTRAGGIEEILNGREGCAVVGRSDEAGLARAMARLVAEARPVDPGSFREFGKECIARAYLAALDRPAPAPL